MMAEKVSSLTEDNDNVRQKCAQQKRKIEALQAEQKKLIHGNAYKFENHHHGFIQCRSKHIISFSLFSRSKLIEELSGQFSAQSAQLKRLGAFHSEKRQYEARLERQSAEIAELSGALGANTEAARANETALAQARAELSGMSVHKSAVDACLDEASEAIKMALTFQVSLAFLDFRHILCDSRNLPLCPLTLTPLFFPFRSSHPHLQYLSQRIRQKCSTKKKEKSLVR